MTNQTAESDVRSNPLYSKVVAQINEEKLIKDLTSYQLNRIKQMEELADEVSSSADESVRKVLAENLQENPRSVLSRLILGLDGLKAGNTDAEDLIVDLMKDFQKTARWPIVEAIAERILKDNAEHRAALHSMVEAVERLRGKKEVRPYLEKLASMDEQNPDPDVARRYGMLILEDDADRAGHYLKQAAESYARLRDYAKLEEIWSTLVDRFSDDIPFFEKIERILSGYREKTRIAAYFASLVEVYRQLEDWDTVILLLKKILIHEPSSNKARSDLVRAYKQKYGGHSLLNEFLRISEITNVKKPVNTCIASFERNIVFDTGNFVYHRTRGVGKIASIDPTAIVIDFKGNEGQKMTLEMAISSLQPMEPSHIWVKWFTNPDEVTDLFQNDIRGFFRLLLESYNHKIVLADIKSEVIDRLGFLKAKDWSSWWNKTRTTLKKDSLFGFNPQKRDELILHKQEISYNDELDDRFHKTKDWNKKLEIALEALREPESANAATSCAQFFYEEERKTRDPAMRFQCFFYLAKYRSRYPDGRIQSRHSDADLIEILKASDTPAILRISESIDHLEFKERLVQLLIKGRPDFAEILKQLLFETPIKAHRYILNELNHRNETEVLRSFVQAAFRRYQDYPEVFLWAARSILAGQWNHPWMEMNREDTMLQMFRLLKPLSRIEEKGNRLKNQLLRDIFGTTNIVADDLMGTPLEEIVKTAQPASLRRMSALFREVPYVPDAHKDNFDAFLSTVRPDFTSARDEIDEEIEERPVDLLPPADVILVSPAGLEKLRNHFNHLVNVELPENSRDIGAAQEKGDLRENAEYKAALERQSSLQAEITRVDAELKKAKIIESTSIRTDIVTIGSKVSVTDGKGEKLIYSILGPWDADTDKGVISYVSPLGKSLIGKSVGDTATLEGGQSFKIDRIEKGL
ncbi:MAG: transcription elongation factor GreA [Leptonema illini]|uniref:Transcription elongation factor GreA n=1 Tax=Leptonema illini TaxID=183 RepID=A0A833LZS9_9LEPT|nr:MAG: transcription elongation factor GreA [Leptonema illini]